jgi:transposase-like protein
MRAYSTDLKERLVRAVADGLPMREAARRFSVAVTTVKRAVVHQRETGSLARKPLPGRPRAIRREHEASLRAAGSGARCHGIGTPRLVGGAPGAAVERGDHVAGHAPPRLEA